MQSSNATAKEAMDELTGLGYNNLSKRIVHHNEFGESKHMHYWKSQVLRASKGNSLDYKKWLTPNPLFVNEECVEMITLEDFLDGLDSVMDISLKFLQDTQAFTMYTECLSSRHIYAWGNNTYIVHLTDDYTRDSADLASCTSDISKYGMYKSVWYPVNVITHSPWHNSETKENKLIDKNYVCFGIDQNPDIASIGRSILPQVDDIQNVSSCPVQFLVSDVAKHNSHCEDQLQHECYKFDLDNKTGWLFVAIAGFVYTRSVLVMTTDKYGKRRYYSFV